MDWEKLRAIRLPSFAEPKPKIFCIFFLRNFRRVNVKLIHNPHELAQVQEMILNMEGSQYTIYLDVNMGYYCTSTNILDETSKLCTIVLPGLNMNICEPMIRMHNFMDMLRYKTINYYMDLNLHVCILMIYLFYPEVTEHTTKKWLQTIL